MGKERSMAMKKKLENFNLEPVTYCSKCYSLNIVYEETMGTDYCRDCGCMDVKKASIEEWEELYEKRYGHKYVESNHDIRKSPIFMLPIERLKTRMYNDSSWKEICKTLYPTFPDGLGKADSLILLFAKLYQENRLDELRMELVKRNNDKNK